MGGRGASSASGSGLKITRGDTYRQKVDSQQGYEDWEYTGETIESPSGKLYAFENDLGVYYFNEKEIRRMKKK